MALITIILWGIAINVVLLILYYLLHKQIEKFEAVKEKVIFQVKRARTSYLGFYIVIVALLVLVFFVSSEWRYVLIFASIATYILIDIHHDRTRLTLTNNEVVSVKGFLTTRARTILYRDIVLFETAEDIFGEILGYGDIIITVGGSGGEKITFRKVPDYLEVKHLVEKKKISHQRLTGRR